MMLLWSSRQGLFVRSFYTFICKHDQNYVCSERAMSKLDHIKVTQSALARTVNVITSTITWVQRCGSVLHVWLVSTCLDAYEESLDFLILSIFTLNLADSITAFRSCHNGCVYNFSTYEHHYKVVITSRKRWVFRHTLNSQVSLEGSWRKQNGVIHSMLLWCMLLIVPFVKLKCKDLFWPL